MDTKGFQNAVMPFGEFESRFWNPDESNYLQLFSRGMASEYMRKADFYRSFAEEAPVTEKALRWTAGEKVGEYAKAGNDNPLRELARYGRVFYRAYLIMRSHGASDSDLNFMEKRGK